MPSNRATRSKRNATAALANSPPARRRRRLQSSATATVSTTTIPASTSELGSNSTESVNVVASAAPVISPISPEVLEQIISTVTAEVTRRLNSHSLPGPCDTSPVVETAVVSSLPTHTAPHSSLDAVVTDAVQSAHSTITGESSGPQLPNSLHFSANLPLDARISTKLKSKIWNDEYIDFGSLLSNPISANKFQLSVQASSDGLPSSLSLEPLNRPRKVHSISVWMSAFRIFVGVYTKKHPHESPALMKYSDIVQDLADRGHNWQFYDENFRFLRQSERSALPWAHIHWELWLRSQSTQTRSVTSASRNVPPSNKQPFISIPRGYCFKFHKGDECFGCDFKHACFKCGGPHTGLKCNFRGPQKGTQLRSARTTQRNAAPNPNKTNST